jgi:hypothetical protein
MRHSVRRILRIVGELFSEQNSLGDLAHGLAVAHRELGDPPVRLLPGVRFSPCPCYVTKLSVSSSGRSASDYMFDDCVALVSSSSDECAMRLATQSIYRVDGTATNIPKGHEW